MKIIKFIILTILILVGLNTLFGNKEEYKKEKK